MRKNVSFIDEFAVSEVVGAMLLVLIAIIAFAAIYLYVFPLPIPQPEPTVKLKGYVTDDGTAVLEHMGEESLSAYRIVVRQIDGTLINTTTYQNENDPWEIGKCNYPPTNTPLLTKNDKVSIDVYEIYDDGSEYQVFTGILTGKRGATQPTIPSVPPMLISNLRTNSTDEDLICFNYTINASINASTYIYRWMIDGHPLAEFLMPFDTNSSTTTRDYSGNENNGTLFDCVWTENGIVGGAYHFGGSKEHIVIESLLPSCFDDIDHNDCTISIWVNCSFMDQDNKIILEGRKDTQNFVRLYQEDNAFHFGVSVDNTKYVVRTEDILSNKWYHLAAVWDASEKYLAIYTNGVISTIRGNKSFSSGAHDGLSLGHGNSGSGGYWYGYLDEVQIYDRILSDDQIYQIYLGQKSGLSDKEVIVSAETNEGEIWQCIVTPNDGTRDDIPVTSNLLQIINYPGGD